MKEKNRQDHNHCQNHGFEELIDYTALNPSYSKKSVLSASSGEIQNYCQHHGFEGLKDYTDLNPSYSKKSVSSASSVPIRDSDNWHASVHLSKSGN